MTRRFFGLTALALALGLCQLARPVKAMTDDYPEYCGNGWHWKWDGPHPSWASVTEISIDPRPEPWSEYILHDINFTVQNQLTVGVRGGQSYVLTHGLRYPGGTVFSTEIIARGTTPNLGPGQRFNIGGVTHTPITGNYEHVLQLSIR
jgi:hypothetical protein